MNRDRLAQLIGVLEAENSALAKGAAADHDSFAIVKAQCLHDLQRGLDGTSSATFADRTSLLNLRALLKTNALLLNAQIKAREALADGLADLIRSEQSDGTYGRARQGGPYS